ncbi:MAG: quinol dehydrogenase ferredoxin subunit NapH, partial [Azonexus sp.]|nr:quinol dehydrogenase ferredoxin subunit NapH [Azonexus sp.]
RLTQFAILGLFLLGPLTAWIANDGKEQVIKDKVFWLVKGNLNYSYTALPKSIDALKTAIATGEANDSGFFFLPLTDPLVALQSAFAGHVPERLGLIGVAIVVVFYLLFGGRLFCSWVCPVNIVTDTAGWLRRRLGVKGSVHLGRAARYWILGMVLLGSALTGVVLWELINPVSMLHRGLIFGLGMAWTVVLAVFLFDLFVMSRGWCGHLCPVGAFYSLLGRASLLRVAAPARAACNDCMDCFEVCPEPQVIRPALKGEAKGVGPVILAANCTNCGRCIDVCAKDVFTYGLRFNNPVSTASLATPVTDRSAHV